MPASALKKLYLASTMEELQKKANLDIKTISRNKTEKLCITAEKMFKEAEKMYLDQDEEKSFILYFKFVDLILHLKNRSDFKSVKSCDFLSKSAQNAIEKAAVLKASLSKRYADFNEATEKKKNELNQRIKLDHKNKFDLSNKSVERDAIKIEDLQKPVILDSRQVLEHSISALKVLNLLTDHKSKLILMDIRSQHDFQESHIKHSCCINIPVDILTPGITAQKLEEKLPDASLPKWHQRYNADVVVFIDWDTKNNCLPPEHPMHTLKEAMLKWDQTNLLKKSPLILSGGYKDWMLRYPMHTTKAMDFSPLNITKEHQPAVDVSAVEYPDLDDSKEVSSISPKEQNNILPDDLKFNEMGMPNKKIVNGWVNDTYSNSWQKDMSTPSVNRGVKPLIEQNTGVEFLLDGKSNKQVNLDKNKLSGEVSTKNIPEVNRSLKPSVSNIGPKFQDGVNSPSSENMLNAKLIKEESFTKENLAVIKHNKENDFEKLCLRKELEAEESKRIEIQKQEDILIENLKTLTIESNEKEAALQKLKDENLKMKNLLEEQQNAKHQQQNELDIKNIELEKQELMKDVERLRQLRKQKEEGNKRNNDSKKSDSVKENVETKDPDCNRPSAQFKEQAKYPAPHEYIIPLKKNQFSDDNSNRGLSRSHSSPNIAQMVEDELDMKRKHPHVDRTLKPKSIDHGPIVHDEISTVRLRNLNPVFGNCQARPVTGIKNLGNTCFMNSIIQCLSNTDRFAHYFSTGQYRKHINRSNKQGAKGEVAEEFAVIIRALWTGQYKSIAPKDFKNTVSKYLPICIGNEQQDSHEFLVVLMDKLHGDLNQGYEPDPLPKLDCLSDSVARETFWKFHKCLNRSKISEMFEGLLMSTLSCLSCNKKSNSYEVFSCLSLPISTSRCSLSDCLESFLKPEKMSGEGAWDCPKCKQKKDAEKSLVICQLPDILVIQLKRFSYEGLWRRKLQTFVDCPAKLDMRSVSNPLNRSRLYSLYGIVNHFGTLEGGHYTAYCKNNSSGKWYNYDDQEVVEITSDIQTAAAYLLFYAAQDIKT